MTPASLGMPPTHRHTRRHGGEEKTRAGRTEQIEDLAPQPAPSRRATHPGKPHGRPDTRPDRGGAGSHPSPDAAGHADSDRSPLPAPPPAPTPRRSPTQTHKSHTQTHTHTDSRARLLTLGATRRPQAARVCACVTRRHLRASLSFTGTPPFHPHRAAPPGPPPRRPSPAHPRLAFPHNQGKPSSFVLRRCWAGLPASALDPTFESRSPRQNPSKASPLKTGHPWPPPRCDGPARLKGAKMGDCAMGARYSGGGAERRKVGCGVPEQPPPHGPSPRP